MSSIKESQSSSSYNRGEWAELYVLAKILCEQKIQVKVQGIDLAGKELAVVHVRRGTGDSSEVYRIEQDFVLCIHSGKKVALKEICERVAPLLDSIRLGRGMSFSSATGDELMTFLDINQLKKGGREKSDIFLDVHNPISGDTGSQGYTVKALVGSKPTLFNASEPTNFTFRIEPPLSDELVGRYNETDSEGTPVLGIRDMVAELVSKGHTLSLAALDERFRENLELLDSDMPEYIGAALVAYYSRVTGKATSVSAILAALARLNPLHVSNPDVRYKHKIKDFLEATAYGMVPTEPFRGERTASGGLLLVESSGALTSFRLDDKDRSRDYLVDHTYFETASRRRHNFGVLENRDGSTLLKLNLQIRYK